MNQLEANNKLPNVLHRLIGALCRLKRDISHQISNIENDIKHSRSVSRDRNYMLESHQPFDRTINDHNPVGTSNSSKKEISYYKSAQAALRQRTQVREQIDEPEQNEAEDMELKNQGMS